MAINIGIYVYDKAEVLDFSGPFEVFTTATRVQGGSAVFNTYLISEQGGLVRARAGYQVLTDFGFADCPPLDVLIVVGGDHRDELQKGAVSAWLVQQSGEVPLIASVCTGAFLLAKAGVLVDQQVTTHWEDILDLRTMFPALNVVEDVRWVDHGNRVSSAGISAGIDMSLYLVSRLHSAELARRTARQMQFDWTQDGILVEKLG